MCDRAHVLLTCFSPFIRWRIGWTRHCGWHFWLICHASLVVHQFLKDFVFLLLLLLSLCFFESHIGRGSRRDRCWFSMLSLFILESYVDAWTGWCISVKSHLTASWSLSTGLSCLIVLNLVVTMLQLLFCLMCVSRSWSCRRLHTLMPSKGSGDRLSGPYIWNCVLWGSRLVVAASIPNTLIVRCNTFLEVLTIPSHLLSFLIIVNAGFVEVSRSHSMWP